ncbi:MAG TPA: HNH endonuclease signature motif containing protein, partial [Thermoplasmata archaeon]
DRYTCQICRRRLRARHLDVDHVVELARGGAPLDYLNLQAVCRPCHRAKTASFLRGPRTRRLVPGAAVDPPVPLSEDAEWGAGWFPS